MASTSFQTANLSSSFWNERSRICIFARPAAIGVGFTKKSNIECKESRIGKQPIGIPSNVTIISLENTRIVVIGYDKSAIGEFAASIRKWRPPEPYKGKGIKYADEIIRGKS